MEVLKRVGPPHEGQKRFSGFLHNLKNIYSQHNHQYTSHYLRRGERVEKTDLKQA